MARTPPPRHAARRRRIGAIYLGLAAANIVAWAAALLAFAHTPVLLGTALLAYSFGLRHAVDADHIAAIDNVTRKLMQDGKRPLATGLFFSLGHSTIVVALSAAIAIAALAVKQRVPALATFGGIAGTLISAGFLGVIAAINLFVLAALFRTFRRVKAGDPYHEEDLNRLLARRGPFGRLFRGLFRIVTQSWQMYPIGLLFGLGFDTATEVGLLGIAAAEATKGLHVWAIMVFPALFTAGMSLVDTTDGILMLGAYGWAFTNPIRKLFYNLTITAASVLVAIVIGGLELLGLLQGTLALSGPFWTAIATINNNFGVVGYAIIALFATTWLAGLIIYRLGRYDDIAVKTGE
jgi:high-affinity nickel-transport protein